MEIANVSVKLTRSALKRRYWCTDRNVRDDRRIWSCMLSDQARPAGLLPRPSRFNLVGKRSCASASVKMYNRCSLPR
jgi:hypothetical protein